MTITCTPRGVIGLSQSPCHHSCSPETALSFHPCNLRSWLLSLWSSWQHSRPRGEAQGPGRRRASGFLRTTRACLLHGHGASGSQQEQGQQSGPRAGPALGGRGSCYLGAGGGWRRRAPGHWLSLAPREPWHRADSDAPGLGRPRASVLSKASYRIPLPGRAEPRGPGELAADHHSRVKDVELSTLASKTVSRVTTWFSCVTQVTDSSWFTQNFPGLSLKPPRPWNIGQSPEVPGQPRRLVILGKSKKKRKKKKKTKKSILCAIFSIKMHHQSINIISSLLCQILTQWKPPTYYFSSLNLIVFERMYQTLWWNDNCRSVSRFKHF